MVLVSQSAASRFGAATLFYPEHIPRSDFADYEKYASKNITAKANYELWKTKDGDKVHVLGAPSNEFLDDPKALAEELEHAAKAEAEDEAWKTKEGIKDARWKTANAHADMRIGCALRVDFLVALTFVLDLWKWKTQEVVMYFIKPVTEKLRCRFADHPLVREYKGRADALMSHAWGNDWGELVAAAAQGAPMNRFVWICALANRQWPGNKADIDFETMVERTNAIVVANPVPQGDISEELDDLDLNDERDALKLVVKRFTLSRIWCIGKFIFYYSVTLYKK